MRVAIFLLLLTACASIGTERVPNWPALEVTEYRVPHAELRDRCGIYAPALASPEGCAIFRFDQSVCEIVVSADFPDARVDEHERLHCAGYDHPGENNMEAMLRDWNSKQ